ncbi:MAG: hypothetical protein Q4G03_09995 [Planctomycetia bacterium]|nr:hypothetical protein [Planctomycetia bacterium]
MKQSLAFLVATLSVLVAYAAQAAEVNVEFYSQDTNGHVSAARDVHYTIMDLNSEKVAEDKAVNPDGVGASLTLNPGVYFLTAEEPSTHKFGSATIMIEEQGEEDAQTEQFVFTEDGLTQMEDVQDDSYESTQDSDDEEEIQYYDEEEERRRAAMIPWGDGGYYGYTTGGPSLAGILGAGALAVAIVALFFPEKATPDK